MSCFRELDGGYCPNGNNKISNLVKLKVLNI